MKKNSTSHKKREIRFLRKQINLEYKELKEAQEKENEFCDKENGQVLQIVQGMGSDVTSTEILNSTPNDTVSLNCSGLVRKVNLGEPIQLEWPAIRRNSKDFYSRSLISFCQVIFQVQYICGKNGRSSDSMSSDV